MEKSCPRPSATDMAHTQYVILVLRISKAESNLQAAPVPAVELSSLVTLSFIFWGQKFFTLKRKNLAYMAPKIFGL